MKKYITSISIMLLVMVASAQTVTLTFTGRDANNQNVPLDRVVISNLTKGWQDTLTSPEDTVLVMQNGNGIDEFVKDGGFALSQNNPNPFDGTTFAKLYVAERGDVAVEITDITGRVVGTNHYSLVQPGAHEIRVTLSTAGIYFLTARQNGRAVSLKIVNRGNGGGNIIEFADVIGVNNESPLQTKSGIRSQTDNPFDLGDQMEYVGFATINGVEVESEHVMRAQNGSETIVLMFAASQGSTDALPCPGTPTLTDIDGNVYNTVMLGTQCWMKENLRTTHFADNAIIPMLDTVSHDPYRFAPDGEASNVSIYGYLYNWAAVMHGAGGSNGNPSGVQGICPTGWHVPSYTEWTQLTEYVGSREEYVCGLNNNILIAKALADSTGWDSSTGFCEVGNDPGSNNATGFSARPAGGFGTGDVGGNPNYYHNFGNCAFFWTATEYNATYAFWFKIKSDGSGVGTFLPGSLTKVLGFSVRCVRD